MARIAPAGQRIHEPQRLRRTIGLPGQQTLAGQATAKLHHQLGTGKYLLRRRSVKPKIGMGQRLAGMGEHIAERLRPVVLLFRFRAVQRLRERTIDMHAAVGDLV